MIHSGVRDEEVQSSFEDLDLKTNEKSPDAPNRVEDLLGQPSSKFDYKVFYLKPPSYDIPIQSIMPRGWGDEFKDDKIEIEKKEAETPK